MFIQNKYGRLLLKGFVGIVLLFGGLVSAAISWNEQVDDKTPDGFNGIRILCFKATGLSPPQPYEKYVIH